MPQAVSDYGVIPAVAASSQRDEAAGAAAGPLAALLASPCRVCSLCKCLQKGFGHLLQLTVWLTAFPAGVVAPDKNKEHFSWLLFLKPRFEWDMMLYFMGGVCQQNC